MTSTVKTHIPGFATFSLTHLALGLLDREPNHGYQLYQNYQAAFGELWSVGRSKFYAELGSLEERKLLTSTTLMQTDRPPRKIYQITEAGHQMFVRWLYEPVTPVRAIRVELLAKLRFFTLHHLPDADRLIDAQLTLCRETLHAWEQRIAAIDHSNDDPFLECVYDFRYRQAEFIVEWLLAWRDRLIDPANLPE
jgi:DNA-binding PadR family transcriptional regulator